MCGPHSVREVVQSGCQALRGLRPFYTRAEKRRATEAMERLCISALAKRCYRELSGGQRQRVLLARAVCGTCRLLLLDEPTTGLDPDATGEFYRTLRDINSGGVAVVMVSHDLDGALRNATHVLALGRNASFEPVVKPPLHLVGTAPRAVRGGRGATALPGFATGSFERRGVHA